MKNILLLIFALLITVLQFGCKDKSVGPINYENNDTDTIVDRKPNLYIYPTEELNLSVRIDFPNGGEILESIPEYNNGWDVSVKPNGIINDTYEYLFYECKVPDLTQKIYGWLISREDLKQFFESNLSLSGFSEKEIKDFTDYWIPLLKDYRYYEVYPQYKNTLEKMSIISFSKEPTNIFRMQYVIRGRDNENIFLQKPIIETAKREGYFSVEWGVIIK